MVVVDKQEKENEQLNCVYVFKCMISNLFFA